MEKVMNKLGFRSGIGHERGLKREGQMERPRKITDADVLSTDTAEAVGEAVSSRAVQKSWRSLLPILNPMKDEIVVVTTRAQGFITTQPDIIRRMNEQ